MSNQPQKLKVVLEEMETGVMVGVIATGCDPHMTIVQAEIADLLVPQVAEQVAAARARWAENPKHPTYKRPPEPKKPAAAPSRTGTPAARRQAEATQQTFM